MVFLDVIYFLFSLEVTGVEIRCSIINYALLVHILCLVSILTDWIQRSIVFILHYMVFESKPVAFRLAAETIKTPIVLTHSTSIHISSISIIRLSASRTFLQREVKRSTLILIIANLVSLKEASYFSWLRLKFFRCPMLLSITTLVFERFFIFSTCWNTCRIKRFC